MSDVENTEECKTEPMTLDEAIEHAESCVNDTPCGCAHKQLADWLKELKEYKSGKFGNGFAMHSALKEIHDRVNSLDEDCGVDPIDIRNIAREALSKQPRNCDDLENSDSAIDYWNNNSKLLQGLAVFTIDGEQYHNIVEWLYAKKNDKKVEGADK